MRKLLQPWRMLHINLFLLKDTNSFCVKKNFPTFHPSHNNKWTIISCTRENLCNSFFTVFSSETRSTNHLKPEDSWTCNCAARTRTNAHPEQKTCGCASLIQLYVVLLMRGFVPWFILHCPINERKESNKLAPHTRRPRFPAINGGSYEETSSFPLEKVLR